MFNASEYVHLATHASSRGDHIAALGFLKDALASEPKNAAALYFFATECAELGLLERAIKGMEDALAIEPKMDLARFQLSLLYWQTNQPAPARAHLATLQQGEGAELKAYCEALLAIIDNDLEKAKDRLASGLRMEGGNDVLKRNMNNLYHRLVALSLASDSTPEAESVHRSEAGALAASAVHSSASLPGAYRHARTAQ